MPAIHRTVRCTHVPKPFLRHSLFTTTQRHSSGQHRSSGFSGAGQGFTGSYEPDAPTVGPLAQASKSGAVRLTPSLLKEHLDKFVVGQAQAKKVTSVAIYNHYQRIRELRRLDAEDQEKREKDARRLLKERERKGHPVENEFPGHVETVDLNSPSVGEEPDLGSKPLEEKDVTIIEKSNLLLLGPSGVGKTYILQTLSHILEVPFATVDCSALTQAGYIGTDIESSIERLLLAASHSIQKCETGIIFFDEVDKLAKPAVMTHGRDVSGEGVQQGLLKMIEGTTVTVSAKSERNRGSERDTRGDSLRGGREIGGMQGGGGGGMGGRNEQYTIDTSNILFVFAGAFVGLEKIISSRLQSGASLGFGAQLRNTHLNNSQLSSSSSHTRSANSGANSSSSLSTSASILDSCTPTDLQTYGLIPELLGRIPIITTLHPLSLSQLVSILTEPKNSLVKQYAALFNTYGIQLKFTTLALRAIAERALDRGLSPAGGSAAQGGASGGIGARGLRSIMECVLGEIMFWGPGSGIRFCLVDEAFVRGHDSSSSQFTDSDPLHATERSVAAGKAEGPVEGGKSMMPRCWSRGQGSLFEEAWEKEELLFKKQEEDRGREKSGEAGAQIRSFERYREASRSGM